MAVCKQCRWFDETERGGSYNRKGYCTSYKTYEDPDKYRDCKRFEPKGYHSSGNCYLTSACVDAMGLADDCRELTLLRNFRDTYMKNLPEGQKDIEHYYAVAPKIVEAVNAHPDAKAIWEKVYHELVEKCVRLIEANDLAKTYQTYKIYSLQMEEAYL